MLNLSIFKDIIRHVKTYTLKTCPLLTVLDVPYGRKGVHFNHGTHCLLTLGSLALSLGLFTLVLGGAVWACISGVGTCTQLLPVLYLQASFPECLLSPILTHRIWQIYFPEIPSSYQQSCPRALNISSLFAILRIRSALTSGTGPFAFLLPIRKYADWEQLAQTQPGASFLSVHCTVPTMWAQPPYPTIVLQHSTCPERDLIYTWPRPLLLRLCLCLCQQGGMLTLCPELLCVEMVCTLLSIVTTTSRSLVNTSQWTAFQGVWRTGIWSAFSLNFRSRAWALPAMWK